MRLLSHPGAGWYIRLAGPADKDRIEAIFCACLKDFPWRGSVESELNRLRKSVLTSHFFVAEETRAGVIGFLTLEKPTAYIPHLFVDEDWRFCGVGQGLLAVARDEAGKPLRLDVDAQNDKARAAYAAMGWRELAKAAQKSVRPGQVRLIGP